MAISRRNFVVGVSAGLMTLNGVIHSNLTRAEPTSSADIVIQKPVWSSGELIPAIGMGTWITFNVGGSQRLRDARVKVLERFFKGGGTVIDSSPMYGSAEEVLGYCLNKLPGKTSFSATKTWTSSSEEGKSQFADSTRLWGLPKLDLLQIHNLVAWQTHLPYLRELKQQGKIRYVGITTSHSRRHSDIEHILEREPLDFLQLTYNISDRDAEQRLLPLAADKGVSVICNRPFQGGRLPDHTSNKKLPVWAPELGCTTWPQLMLKYVISHPSVTAAIPATSKVEHMDENMRAVTGVLPSISQRQQILAAFKAL